MDTNEQKKIEEARLKAERRTGKYLSFLLDGEECGMNIISESFSYSLSCWQPQKTCFNWRGLTH